MPTTLVTGANGFVGATVIAHLLASGHNVIATVRSLSAVAPLLSLHPDWPTSPRLTFLPIPSFTVPTAFDALFQSHPEITHVAHVAAPVLDNPANTDFERDFEAPSIQGNTALLSSAKKYGKNVKSVVVVGSINAITTGDPAELAARVLDSSAWLPLGREEAIQMQNAYISYCVGKKLAEKAIWTFVEEEKPDFSITNFCMPLIFGPAEQHIQSMSRLNFSSAQVYSWLSGGPNAVVPATAFPGYIDVRDLAELMVRALTEPAAANKRFVVGHTMSFRELSGLLREEPGFGDKVGKENVEDEPVLPNLDTSEVEAAFPGFKWRSKKETVVDTAKKLVEIEGRVGA